MNSRNISFGMIRMSLQYFALWRQRAAIRYKDMICTAKGEYMNDGKKVDFIPDEHWDKWKAYWNRDDVKQNSHTAKNNRLAELEGPGTGIIRHRGGSRSAQQYAAILAQELKVPENEVEWQVFLQFHCKDGEYTDQKSKRIAERVYELAAERRQPLPNTTEEREVDMSKIFIEVAAENSNNGRIFGTGCRAALYKNADLGGPSNVNTAGMTDQLSQLQTQLQSEREERLALEEQVQKQAQEHARMKEQLDKMMQHWMRSSSDGSPPS